MKPLSRAAESGDHEAVAKLLADPSQVDDSSFAEALQLAAKEGHSKVVTQLLAANPDCIDAVDEDGRTALHVAVSEARHAVAKQLLAAKPELIEVLDNSGRTVLHEAASSGGHASEEELSALGITPKEVDIYGFGSVIRGECCHEIVALVFNLDPRAATCEDEDGHTPFLNSIVYKNEFAIELLQWKLSFDDIVAAFTSEVLEEDTKNYVERYQPVMEKQCEALFPLLGDDIIAIVFECLGLETRKRQTKRQRV